MCNLKLAKFLSVLLSALILCTIVFSTNVFAEVSVSSDFVIKETTLDENRIYPYYPNDTYYEITGFSETANVENITKLMLEDGKTDKIGKEAFKNNPYIEEIFLDNKDFANNNGGNYSSDAGLRSIGESAFENCTALKKISLYYTTKLHSISKINIVEICNSAFKGCTSLEEFEVPASVTYIDSKAFADCTSLKKVAIYELTTEIADDAFENCDKLTIYGKSNSPAHKYAIEKNIPFVSIDYMSLMSMSNIVGELCTNILYMDVMLKNYTIENNYAQFVGSEIFPVNFQDYYFQDYWSDELNKVLSETKRVFENPFATEDELLTVLSNSQEAIYKAELIEEIGRLIEPFKMHNNSDYSPIYHHTGPCDYCAKVITLFCYPGSPVTHVSYLRYQEIKNEAYGFLEAGNISSSDLDQLWYSLHNAIDGLLLESERKLSESVAVIKSYFDLSKYTSDSVSMLNECIREAESITNKGYYYRNSDFLYTQNRLDTAVAQLRLISYNELESKWLKYQNICSPSFEQYKYTQSSWNNLYIELENTYNNIISPYNIMYQWSPSFPYEPPYGFPYQNPYEAHIMLNNDVVVAQTERLTEAYNNLELKPLGDVNQDGINSVIDVIYTLKGVVDSTYLYDEEYQYFADMNSDGKVTVLDAILLQRNILEMA